MGRQMAATIRTLIVWALAAGPFYIEGQCISNLDTIVSNEADVSDVSELRIYNLCANTIFQVGASVVNGDLQEGQAAIALRSNARVRCTTTGLPGQNCVVRGGFEGIGVVLSPVLFDGEGSAHLNDVSIEGVTFESFTPDSTVMAWLEAMSGKVTFRKCIFKSSRSGLGFFWHFKVTEGDSSRRVHETKSTLSADKSSSTKERLRGILAERRSIIMEMTGQSSESKTGGKGDQLKQHENGYRQLQEAGNFTIQYEHCEFVDLRDLETSPSAFFFASGIVYDDLTGQFELTQVQGLNLKLYNNLFQDNNLLYESDILGPVYRNFIQFLNTNGHLHMENNCFINSPLSPTTFSSIALIDSTSSYTAKNNFASPQDLTLDQCPMIWRNDIINEKNICELDAQLNATECGRNLPLTRFCFSAGTAVEVKGKGKVRMQDLKIGDFVRDGQQGYQQYSRVYSFGHYAPKSMADYLVFYPSMLEISQNHMVYLKNQSVGPIPASHVKVGDILANQDEPVSSIGAVRRRGAYAPFTTSGKLLVNGVLVSSYVAFQDSPVVVIGGTIQTGISYHWVAHVSQVPRRLYCWARPSMCDEEHYTEEGIATWLEVSWRWALWLTDQANMVLFTLLVCPLLALWLVLSFFVVFIVCGKIGSALVTLSGVYCSSLGYWRKLKSE